MATPTHRAPKPPEQQKKKFQKPQNLRESLISPNVNVISPKVNAISPKVNAMSPKVDIKYFLGIFEEFKVFEIFCRGVTVTGVSKISNLFRLSLEIALRDSWSKPSTTDEVRPPPHASFGDCSRWRRQASAAWACHCRGTIHSRGWSDDRSQGGEANLPSSWGYLEAPRVHRNTLSTREVRVCVHLWGVY